MELIVDRLSFLADLLVGDEAELMSKLERSHFREVLDLIEREPQVLIPVQACPGL